MIKLLNEQIEKFSMDLPKDRKCYNACYNSFAEYMNESYECTIKELFEKNISWIDVEEACIRYFKNSKKTRSVEAINRFLSSIDLFYEHLVKKYDIHSALLEKKCRCKERVEGIVKCLNENVNQKIFLPLEPKVLLLAQKCVDELNDNNFYQLGQKIIFELLTIYGFKSKIIGNMKWDSIENINHGILKVYGDDGCLVELKLEEKILRDLKKFIKIHKFRNGEFLFTKLNGKQLQPDYLQTLKKKMDVVDAQLCNRFNTTAAALTGMENLISKGLTIPEIRLVTQFEMKKISDVSEYLLLLQEGTIGDSINKKMSGFFCF